MLLTTVVRQSQRKSGRRAPRRGVSCIEFAFVAPLFFTLIFGLIEFGRGIMSAHVTLHATRVVTREATVAAGNASTLRERLTNEMQRSSIPRQAVTISRIAYQDPRTGAWTNVASMADAPPRARIRITTEVDQKKASWLPTQLLHTPGAMTTSVTMTKER